MILCTVLFVLVLYRHYEMQTFHSLETELTYITHGIELSGETYLETLEIQDRVTWIDAEGNVIYDSEVATEDMTNHLSRTEIRDAFETGSGQSVRWSETLLEYNLYAATLLDDGTVLRASCTQSSVIALLFTLFWSILGILVLITAICILLSYRLARHIVAPINQIDLEHPAIDTTYPELNPLVEHIRAQNQTIQNQMDELKRKQREFTALTDNMCEGFLLVDTEMNVLSGNSTAIGVLNHGCTFKNLRQDNVFPPVILTLEGALSGTRTTIVEEIDARSWQIIANPIRIHGEIAGAVILLMDITEQEQREQLRQEFSANVSHELKTPLTSISGFAELLSSGLVPPEKVAEFSGDIYRESQRLIRLVNDIIQLSKLDEDVAFSCEEVDLFDLCAENVEILSVAAKEKNVSLTLSGEHAHIYGVRQILNDMVYNLCDNAIKYNVSGGTVTITVHKPENHVTLCVRDTGIGIPFSEQSRVFERFYRVDKSRSQEIGGTGLGLSIVKHAAQYHHASLNLHSIPGHGTTITITF